MHDAIERDHLAVSTSSDATDGPTPGHVRRIDLERTTRLIGRTEGMAALRKQVERYAKTHSTVIIHGETGTGKELVARALHHLSPRARMPFVTVNVAAVSETLLISELFGHERGAFTGAHVRHRGLCEQAHGGTLFLDEVGELPPDAQAALLRVLETREVRPVGAEYMRKVDIRLVAATHRNLLQMVRQGTFRDDLYYRLNLLVVEVPALRYRTSDVPYLARHILQELRCEYGSRTLAESALTPLTDYAWPGNVRQLQNVLRRMAASTDDATLTGNHVRSALRYERDGAAQGHEAATTATVLSMLAAEQGNITRTARRLGIARSTVRAHLRRAGRGSAV